MSCTLKKFTYTKRHSTKIYLKRFSRNNCQKKSANLEIKAIERKDDMIGPADPISNLRPIIFAQSEDESNLEKKYRQAREETQRWNKNFWTKHNINFATERKQFQNALKAEGKLATADDMSVFYKKFLDKNWKTHVNYNLLWYKKNCILLFYEIRVRFSKMKFT